MNTILLKYLPLFLIVLGCGFDESLVYQIPKGMEQETATLKFKVQEDSPHYTFGFDTWTLVIEVDGRAIEPFGTIEPDQEYDYKVLAGERRIAIYYERKTNRPFRGAVLEKEVGITRLNYYEKGIRTNRFEKGKNYRIFVRRFPDQEIYWARTIGSIFYSPYLYFAGSWPVFSQIVKLEIQEEKSNH